MKIRKPLNVNTLNNCEAFEWRRKKQQIISHRIRSHMWYPDNCVLSPSILWLISLSTSIKRRFDAVVVPLYLRYYYLCLFSNLLNSRENKLMKFSFFAWFEWPKTIWVACVRLSAAICFELVWFLFLLCEKEKFQMKKKIVFDRWNYTNATATASMRVCVCVFGPQAYDMPFIGMS